MARPAIGTVKYCQDQAKTLSLVDELPIGIREDIRHAVSHSLARKTWLSYKTAERMLAKFLKEQNKPLTLPIQEVTVLGFVHWLAYKRNLKAGTISGYLAGIRNLHIMKGLPEPEMRSELVKLVLEGRKNIEAIQKLAGTKRERQPVTTDILRLLKARLNSWTGNRVDKLTAWLVCSLLFHAACRGGELLCKREDFFDPAVELLRQDMLLKQNSATDGGMTIQLKLKQPKEAKDRRATVVDIFETKTDICPVRAFRKWQTETATDKQDAPAFVWQNGKPVTTRAMNALIKNLLDPVLPEHGISVHSFRTGAASLMGQLGYSDNEIKSIGRWSSRAFECYIKLDRSRRVKTLRKLSKDNAWL